MPYGPTGKLVTPPFIRPILIITVWDAIALLWTFNISQPPRVKYNYNIKPSRMKFQNQTAYLVEMLLILANKILKMGEDLAHPATANLTFSTRKGKIVKYFFGVSIWCRTAVIKEEKTQMYETNKLAAKARVEMMNTLFSNV